MKDDELLALALPIAALAISILISWPASMAHRVYEALRDA